MPSSDRTGFRDVFFYNQDLTFIGGLVVTPGITNANFHSMVRIATVISSPSIFLQDADGKRLPQDNDPLTPGKYYIVADGHARVSPNPEPVYPRGSSVSTGPRVRGFRKAVRKRDGRCIITKRVNPLASYGEWTSFHTAHIFPLSQEADWTTNNLDQCITLPPVVGGTINSVQNGLLLDAGIHQLFNSYLFPIDPDDNYKIVFFQPDSHGVAGTFLDRQLLDNPRRPPDELFRWHYRQAVLANVRGKGEPTFEHDFPPGSDMLGETREGPKAAERMEAELFGRLAAEVGLE